MYEEEIVRAIRNRFAGDIMTCLRDANPMELVEPVSRITLPLRAGVKLLYDHKLASFVVEGRTHDVSKNNCLMCRQIFSSQDINTAKDSAEIISYLLDSMKHQFTRALVAGELESILNKRPTKADSHE